MAGRAADPRRGARRAFLAAALRNPGQFGAVAPSSPSLAGVIASVVPTAGAPVVVELGPGTGAVTTAIDARLPPARGTWPSSWTRGWPASCGRRTPGWRSSKATR